MAALGFQINIHIGQYPDDDDEPEPQRALDVMPPKPPKDPNPTLN
jgi:hypothetical protein